MSRLGRYFRKRASKSYNSKKWESASRNGKISWIFGDSKGLDISARSKIRLRQYDSALAIYDLAENRGLRLRDHFANKCQCQIYLDRIVDAFETMQQMDPLQKYDPIPAISKSLRSRNQAERRDLILDMMAISDVPDEFMVHLSEWSKSSVEKRHMERVKDSEARDKHVNNESESLDIPDFSRDSAEYALGSILVEAYHSPLKIVSLPFRLIREGVRLKSERLPKNPPKKNTGIWDDYKASNSVIFFPTNGVGFGHFARCYSIAERMRRNDPDIEIVFLTTMPTLHFLSDINALAYHLPGRYRYSNLSASEWNSMLSDLMITVLKQHAPKAFIFDGAYPYKGMTDVLRDISEVKKYWVRRSGENVSAKPLPEGRMSVFDYVIKPGDSIHVEAMNEVDSNTKLIRCDPILISDQFNVFPKGSLRKRLGIPEEAVLAYVQLGAGKINKISSELKNSLDAISSHSSAYIVYGESILGERRILDHPRIRTLRDFPNSRYFSDIDFAILAGGYNSYHEAVQFSIPTIMFPNLKTKRDDQSARVKAAGELGCMIVLNDRGRKTVRAAVDRIMDEKVRREMREAYKQIELINGAETIAKFIQE